MRSKDVARLTRGGLGSTIVKPSSNSCSSQGVNGPRCEAAKALDESSKLGHQDLGPNCCSVDLREHDSTCTCRHSSIRTPSGSDGLSFIRELIWHGPDVWLWALTSVGGLRHQNGRTSLSQPGTRQCQRHTSLRLGGGRLPLGNSPFSSCSYLALVWPSPLVECAIQTQCNCSVQARTAGDPLTPSLTALGQRGIRICRPQPGWEHLLPLATVPNRSLRQVSITECRSPPPRCCQHHVDPQRLHGHLEKLERSVDARGAAPWHLGILARPWPG